MPQIWLTYDELGALLGCDAAAAREASAARPLDRRRCHDGRTRAKLDLVLTEQWLDRLVRHWAERQLAACVDDLDRVRRLMAAPSSGAVDEVATTAHNETCARIAESNDYAWFSLSTAEMRRIGGHGGRAGSLVRLGWP